MREQQAIYSNQAHQQSTQERKKNPISISQPDGGKLESTHECEIDKPKLPQEARKAHIVPGLAHTSLISIKMLIDAGCFVTYGENVLVYYKDKIVWTWPTEELTGLWVLPLIKNMQISQQSKKYGKEAQDPLPPRQILPCN